jgi:hypothetical protein
MVKRLYLLCLLLTQLSLFATSYTVHYKHAAKSIQFYSVMPAKTDSRGNLLISQVFDIPVSIKQVRIYSQGRYIPCRYTMKKDFLIIRKTRLKDTTVDLFMDYTIEMKVFRRFLLPGRNLVIPLYVFKPQDVSWQGRETATCYVELPERWSLLSPSGWEKLEETGEENPVYTGSTDWQEFPMILAGRKIVNHTPDVAIDSIVTGDQTGDKPAHFTWFGQEPVKNLMRDPVQNNLRMQRLHNYLEHLEQFFNIPIEKETFNILIYFGLMNISVAADDAMLMSAAHLASLGYKRENNNTYQIIYELAYILIRDRIDFKDFKRDSWLIDGMCHMAASSYFQEKYGLELNQTNTNRFIKFMLGKRNSMYTRSGTMFRDYIKFRKINTITRDNTPKLIGYNYRSRVLKNRYSVQVFNLIRTLHSQAELKILIQKILARSDEPLTTGSLIYEIDYWLSSETAQTVTEYIRAYPLIDYQLKVDKGTVKIVRLKGDAILPVTVEYTYKTGKKEREIVLMDQDTRHLSVTLAEIKRITLDPDSLIDEISKSNNYYRVPVSFSLITPFNIQDNYSFVANLVMVQYFDIFHFGASITGGWNMKQVTTNTLTKPKFLWGVDFGYGPDTNSQFRFDHNGFINLFFETSVFPRSVWAPHIYSHIFFHSGEGASYKIGVRSFIPPVYNTEHDSRFFNHSWDAGIDVKVKYHPVTTVDMNINAGYKIFFKSRFYTLEAITGVNFDFDGQDPAYFHDIIVMGQVDNKFDFRILEFGIKTGIRQGQTPWQGYEYQRPKITRFSLVTQSTGYFETMANSLDLATSILSDYKQYPLDQFYLHHYLIFKLVVLSEPLLDPLITIGFGPYIDYILPMVFSRDPMTGKLRYESRVPRFLFSGLILKIDIMRKTTVALKFAAAPFYWANNRFGSVYQLSGPLAPKLISLLTFEIRAYL